MEVSGPEHSFLTFFLSIPDMECSVQWQAVQLYAQASVPVDECHAYPGPKRFLAVAVFYNVVDFFHFVIHCNPSFLFWNICRLQFQNQKKPTMLIKSGQLFALGFRVRFEIYTGWL